MLADFSGISNLSSRASISNCSGFPVFLLIPKFDVKSSSSSWVLKFGKKNLDLFSDILEFFEFSRISYPVGGTINFL